MATNTTHATSQASVSESNRSRIVKHLYHNGISSRAQIAKALELTPAAITKITARLIEAGMIEETGDLEGSKNRRSIGLKLNTTRFRVIGIKFARSLVQIGVFGLCGNDLSIENLPTVYDNTIDDTIATIHQRVEQLLDNDPSIVAIGMAVPAYLRNVGRTAVVSNMQGWRKINFIDRFATAFVPVFIEQDARRSPRTLSLRPVGARRRQPRLLSGRRRRGPRRHRQRSPHQRRLPRCRHRNRPHLH